MEAIERTLKWTILGGWFIFNCFLIIVLKNIVQLRKKYYAGEFEEDLRMPSRTKSQISMKEKVRAKIESNHVSI